MNFLRQVNVYSLMVLCFLLAISYSISLFLKNKRIESNIELVKKSFDIFNAPYLEEAVAKYHDVSYKQYSDGKVLNYDDLLSHVKYLKSVLASKVEIIYDDIVADQNTVCTVHRAKASKKDGTKVEIKVIAFHKIMNNKIVSTDELTHVLTGDEQDKKLGSAH
ncbi:hypothetical protein IPH25_02505 [bacterium]|nr:MAG: hypothetical protein IPG37_04645 [bacterium]QQR62294.1 MAG: hypothetical protein IPH25_02505 [bacterium]QQR63138.1 MAG: hypothetical protein IPH67_01545 [bacterium]